MRRCLVLGSLAKSLTNFRGELLHELAERGVDVIVSAPPGDPVTERQLQRRGYRFVAADLDRAGMNPLRDLQSWVGLVKMLRREKPTHLLTYTMKPVLYGGLAARLVGGIRTVPILTGMGSLFVAEETGARLVRRGVEPFLKLALDTGGPVLVQNPDDADLVRRSGLASGERVRQIAGSGVDLEHFRVGPLLGGPPRFLMIARMLIDKGVAEYIAAARAVRAVLPDAEFDFVGPREDHARAVAEADLAGWRNEGIVRFHDWTDDVRPYLEACTIYVLPSYREGMPRSVLEAMAGGRPVITTDVPGCRSSIENGVSGLLVRVADAEDLAAKMIELAGAPERIREMGIAARHRAEEVFDVKKVNHEILVALGLERRANREVDP